VPFHIKLVLLSKQPECIWWRFFKHFFDKNLCITVLRFLVRSHLFMVVPSKANFNLLLGRKWIHGIGVVPSSMHQRISIGRDEGIVENIETDRSYFLVEINQIKRKTFDKNLANIAPCSSAKIDDANQADASSVKLHPAHGFMWERETFDT